MFEKRIHKKIAPLTALLIVFAGVFVTHAQVMQSSNYQIQADSINFGGGLSTSTNYYLESTYGEIATGYSTSTSYELRAGYQQMHGTFLSMTAAGDVTMTPPIPGITGGTSTGSTFVVVTTDSSGGYELAIQVEGDPALQSGAGDSFANYTTAGVAPDFAFTIDPADSEFGFSPEGADVVQRYQDSGGICNVSGSDTVDACWDALATTDTQISASGSPNHPNGATTTVKFRAASGGGHFQPVGTYTATTTLTAIAL